MLDSAQPALPLRDELPVVPSPARADRRKIPPSEAPSPCAVVELRAMRQAFLGLSTRWALTGEEALRLLGEPDEDGAAREERLRDLLGIHRSLLSLLPERDTCLGYLRRPDPAFDGAPALQVMLADGRVGIARVRGHLADEARRPLPRLLRRGPDRRPEAD